MGWGDNKYSGWVKAPRDIELEIRSVWQEDEMPAELKDDPSYLPFTLGLAAQDWVDSMSEIVDGGKAVYGRPKPAAPAQHRSLTTPPPAPPAPPAAPVSSGPQRAPSYTPPVGPAPDPTPGYWPSPPREARVLMPDIDDTRPPSAPPPRTLPKRVLMPDIGDPVAPPSKNAAITMPDIESGDRGAGGRSAPPSSPAGSPTSRGGSSIPDIGGDEPHPAPRAASMPDIADSGHSGMPGRSRPCRTLQSPVARKSN